MLLVKALDPHAVLGVPFDKLTKQALELQSQFKDGKTTVTLATGTFLKDWLTKHISGTDKKYTEHLHSRGVK